MSLYPTSSIELILVVLMMPQTGAGLHAAVIWKLITSLYHTVESTQITVAEDLLFR
jgi:hypothetical protein